MHCIGVLSRSVFPLARLGRFIELYKLFAANVTEETVLSSF